MFKRKLSNFTNSSILILAITAFLLVFSFAYSEIKKLILFPRKSKNKKWQEKSVIPCQRLLLSLAEM